METKHNFEFIGDFSETVVFELDEGATAHGSQDVLVSIDFQTIIEDEHSSDLVCLTISRGQSRLYSRQMPYEEFARLLDKAFWGVKDFNINQ